MFCNLLICAHAIGEHYEHLKHDIIQITYPSHLKTLDTSIKSLTQAIWRR